jgi:serine/threonine protein kinase
MSRIDAVRWRLVSRWLDQLLDVNDADRRQRLDQIRLHDRSLAAELEGLLSHDDKGRRESFLDTSVLPTNARRAGEVVGDYTLESVLGHGATSSVWLARCRDGRVAIKFLNLASMCRGGMRLFRREARMLATLHHPGIARLLGADVAVDGQPYLVLEAVEGLPLDAWCEAHVPDTQARVRVFLEVLAAVAHAHDRKVLHRDLKPSNILVTPAGRVKLLDFGIARLQGEAETDPMTRAACAAYTLDFAAPEQVRLQTLTTATDVYALGVILYGLLTGVHPTSDPDASAAQRLEAIVSAVPPRLSLAAAAAFPEGLEEVLAKALSKSPTERHANASELADALRLGRSSAAAARDRRGALRPCRDRRTGPARCRPARSPSTLPPGS